MYRCIDSYKNRYPADNTIINKITTYWIENTHTHTHNYEKYDCYYCCRWSTFVKVHRHLIGGPFVNKLHYFYRFHTCTTIDVKHIQCYDSKTEQPYVLIIIIF